MSKRKYRKGPPLDFASAIDRIFSDRCIIVMWGGVHEQTMNAAWARGWSVNMLRNLCAAGHVFEAEVSR